MGGFWLLLTLTIVPVLNTAFKSAWNRFLTLYLLDAGYRAKDVGSMRALSSFVKIIFQLGAPALAESNATGLSRPNLPIYLAACAIGVSTLCIVGIHASRAMFFVVLFKVSASGMSGATILLDGIAIDGCKRAAVSFSYVQTLQTVSWCASTWLFGCAIDRWGWASFFGGIYVLRGSVLLAILFLSYLPSPGKTDVTSQSCTLADYAKSLTAVVADPGLSCLMLSSCSLGFVFIVIEQITVIEMSRDFGVSNGAIGISAMISMIGGVVAFRLVPPLLRSLGCVRLMMLGQLTGCAFLLLSMFIGSRGIEVSCVASVPLAFLRGVAYAFCTGGQMEYVLRRAPVDMLKSIQALAIILWFTVGGGFGNSLWLHLYEHAGSRLSYTVAICWLGLSLAAHQMWHLRIGSDWASRRGIRWNLLIRNIFVSLILIDRVRLGRPELITQIIRLTTPHDRSYNPEAIDRISMIATRGEWQVPNATEKYTFATDRYSARGWQTGILRSRGFKQVDVRSMDWDVYAGANVHAGGGEKVDWKLQSPRNPFSNMDFFRKLRPGAILQCEGYRSTIFNKRGLCEVAHKHELNGEFSPVCFLLPEHAAFAESVIRKQPDSIWLFKQYAYGTHAGKGIEFAKAGGALQRLERNDTIIQQHVVPYIWPFWSRKSEHRAYVVITSIVPLRAYLGGIWVLHAPAPYSSDAKDMENTCIHMVHAQSSTKCPQDTMKTNMKEVSFEYWAEKLQLSASTQHKIRQNIKKSIVLALLAGHAGAARHPWQKWLRGSSFSCLSRIRFDMSIGGPDENKASILEVNEYPYVAHAVPAIRRILEQDWLAAMNVTGMLSYKRSTYAPQLEARLREFCIQKKCTRQTWDDLWHLEEERMHRGSLDPIFPTANQEFDRFISEDDRQPFRIVQEWLRRQESWATPATPPPPQLTEKTVLHEEYTTENTENSISRQGRFFKPPS